MVRVVRDDSDAVVISMAEFRRRKARVTPNCADCLNAYLGPQGVFCIQWREIIEDEIAAAADCDAYTPEET